MVCNRCVKVVTDELQKLGLKLVQVKLGLAEIEGKASEEIVEEVKSVLEQNGFELIEDKKKILIEALKTLVIRQIHQNQEDAPLQTNYSGYLSQQLGVDYTYLSSLFSTEEGLTIEKYIISQKIERAKELLTYQELTLSEIAYQMGYSSVHHLSNQFKKVTGITPKDYKAQNDKERKSLDRVK